MYRRAPIMLVFAALCVSNSLRADPFDKVRTPGTSFNKVGTKGRVDDIAGGRRVRAEPGDRVKISAPLRVPSSAPGTVHRMRRMIVRFRTSPGGPALRSVELQASPSPFHAEPNLEGDFTSKETANVWTWNPPIKVDSRTQITLELQFHGGFEGNSSPQDFVLLSADAEFQIDFKRSVQSGKDAVFTPGRDPDNPGSGSAKVSPTDIWPNGKAYFFKGPNYLRYDPNGGSLPPGKRRVSRPNALSEGRRIMPG